MKRFGNLILTLVLFFASSSALAITVNCELDGSVDREFVRLHAVTAMLKLGFVPPTAPAEIVLSPAVDVMTGKKTLNVAYDGKPISNRFHGVEVPSRFEVSHFQSKHPKQEDSPTYLVFESWDAAYPFKNPLAIQILDMTLGKGILYVAYTESGVYNHLEVTQVWSRYKCQIQQ